MNKKLFEPAMQQAEELWQHYDNGITLEYLIELLNSTAFKRCPASVEFCNSEIPNPKFLAFAKPDAQTSWSRYTVYLREFFRNDMDGQRLVLAHELCHVSYGQWVSEFDCDNYAAILLGLSYSEYRDRIHAYEGALNIC